MPKSYMSRWCIKKLFLMKHLILGLCTFFKLSIMEYRRLTHFIVLIVTMLTSMETFAQHDEKKNIIPLHVEASLGAVTPCKDILPFEVNFDLNYTFAKRFSLHAITSTSYFLPKEGITSDYNRATNVGGGIGCIFFPQKNDNLGDFELRTSVTTSVGSSDFKNTSYNIGIHWCGHSERHSLVPTVGIGYSYKDFSQKNMPNTNGAYFTLGLRF